VSKPRASRRELGLVEKATVREIKQLPDDLAESGLAASAITMARLVDDNASSTTSRTMAQNRLAEALRELRSLAPPKQEANPVDDLAARRAARVAGSAGP
jgi:hypothetical protein